MTTSIYNFTVTNILGEPVNLGVYQGNVLLIVNVASHCGFTRQYAGLQALYEQNKNKGLVVLGFPCNQFRQQEPNAEDQILEFCTTRYNVSFPMFAKIDVNGAHASPLYRWLTDQKRGLLGTRRIKWNFTKFLISRDGHVVRRYAPQTQPANMGKDLAALLSEQP